MRAVTRVLMLSGTDRLKGAHAIQRTRRMPYSVRLPSEALRGAGRPEKSSAVGAARRTAAQGRPAAAARAGLAGRAAGRALTASGAACAACACCMSAWRGSAYETVSVRPFILRRSETGFNDS